MTNVLVNDDRRINTDKIVDDAERIAAQAAASHGRITAVPISKFNVIVPHFLEPWLLFGMGTTLYHGDNAVGKSATGLWTAARVTRGDCDGELHDPANVLLLLLSEDNPGIIRPKLEALGADMERVFVVVCSRPGESQEEGTNYLLLPDQGDDLERLIAENNIRFMMLDALADCFKNPDVNKTENVAPVLTFLNHLSSKYQMAVVGIHHNRKDTIDGAKNAVRGSKAFTDKARQVVSFVKDEQGYGFQVTKCNFMEDTPAWRYDLESAPIGATGKTTGIITAPIPDAGLDVDKTLRQSGAGQGDNEDDEHTVSDIMTTFLRSCKGERAHPRTVINECRNAGISENTVKTTRKRLTREGVISVRQDVDADGKPQWWWALEDRGVQAPDISLCTPPVPPTENVAIPTIQGRGTRGVQVEHVPPVPPASYTVNLDKLPQGQASGIVDMWCRKLAADPHCLDDKLPRMSPVTLELLCQRGGIPKQIADREYQRRSDSYKTIA